mmetsp:Transcript_15711/g.63273  ORF Transcript_15711/g.63273 Transcript_15711/m.63273 type:complete len:244 (-) Transcript_15711:1804-2535(-)
MAWCSPETGIKYESVAMASSMVQHTSSGAATSPYSTTTARAASSAVSWSSATTTPIGWPVDVTADVTKHSSSLTTAPILLEPLMSLAETKPCTPRIASAGAASTDVSVPLGIVVSTNAACRQSSSALAKWSSAYLASPETWTRADRCVTDELMGLAVSMMGPPSEEDAAPFFFSPSLVAAPFSLFEALVVLLTHAGHSCEPVVGGRSALRKVTAADLSASEMSGAGGSVSSARRSARSRQTWT